MSQILPITNIPNQQLAVSLNVNGTTLALILSTIYNRVGGFWTLSIASQTNLPLVSGIPLVTGQWPAANLLAFVDYMQIGSLYVINQNGATTDYPNDTNLGSGFVLLWDDN